ncbi:hypothetical protein [Labedaea rhizosphaerae]|uniref:Uncharacterized protein n=1 Tax=Labedaea rhizosphaerae TaxID=598644 RepID=A0A4R6SER4_LABRH|nr:hypothetical protein [Labedaea rhizosphaerae]TDP97635.1 hypothetical protein EV186_103599 [Labedaea rhizosphaerae]
MDTLNDKVVAWLRTVWPIAWAALIAWLVTRIPVLAPVAGWLDGLGDQVLTLVIGAAVYPLLRWLESKVPSWLSRILMGSAKQPTYVPPAAGP